MRRVSITFLASLTYAVLTQTTLLTLATLTLAMTPARPALASQPPSASYLWTVGGHGGNPDYGYEEMQISPNGKLLATAAPDGTVKLWDAKTTQLVDTISVDGTFLYCVTFSPDGTRIAVGGATYLSVLGNAGIAGSVNVYDAASGVHIASLPTTIWDITSVAFSPDGTELADAGYIHNSTTSVDDGYIETYDIATQTLLKTMPSAERIGKVAYLPDGRSLITAGYHYDYTLYVSTPYLQQWDARTGALLKTLPTGLSYISGMNFTSGRSAFAVCGRNAAGKGTIEVWSTANLARLATLTGNLYHINDVAFDAAGKNLIAGGYKLVYDATYDIYYHRGAVERWNSQGKRVYTSGVLNQSEINSVAFDPDGASFCTAANDLAVNRYTTLHAALQSTFTRFHFGVNTVAVCDVNDTLAVQDNYGNLALYSATTGAPAAAPPLKTGFLRFVPNSAEMVFLGSGSTGQIKIIQPNGMVDHTVTSQLGSVVDLIFSPDGKLAAAIGVSKQIKGVQYKAAQIYRVADWSSVRQINAFALTSQEIGQGIDAVVAFAPDNTKLAMGVNALTPAGDALLGNLGIYSLQTGANLATVSLSPLHGQDTSMYVIGLTFSGDGKKLLMGIAGANNRTLTVSGAVQTYNTSLKLVHQLNTEESINIIKLAPSGTRLIFGGYTQDPNTGRLAGTLAAMDVATGTVTLRYGDELGTGVNSLDFRNAAGANVFVGRPDATFGEIDAQDLWR